MKNYYSILGITNKANADEIKKAFRMLAKKYHPDVNRNFVVGDESFKEIQEAYMILSNPQKRIFYDQKLKFIRYKNQNTFRAKPINNSANAPINFHYSFNDVSRFNKKIL